MSKKLLAELHAVAGQGLDDRGVERISAVLEEEGITSPAQFADLALTLVERERQRGDAAALDSALLDPQGFDQRRDSNAKLTHREPEVPFYINGVVMEPGDIRRFDGQPLHFLMHGEDEEPRLIACERYADLMHIAQRYEMMGLIRRELAAQQAAARPTVPSPHSQTLRLEEVRPEERAYIYCPNWPPAPGPGAQFFEHHHFEGDWFWLDPGFQYNRLEGKNDWISSVKSGNGRLVLCEHVEFGGSTLTLFGAKPRAVVSEPGHPICGPYFNYWDISMRQNLFETAPIGWSDRISSIVHFH